jgi:ribosome-associated protein
VHEVRDLRFHHRLFLMNRDDLAAEIAALVRLSFSRSGGPGGQNVNRRATRVTARVKIGDLDSLTPEQKDRVRGRLGSRINSEDELVIHVEQERHQRRNRVLAMERMAWLIQGAAAKPRRRKPTAPSAASRERRLDAKRRQSEKKRRRANRSPDLW